MIEDSRFRIEVVSSSLYPQYTAYQAMHQDYCEGFAGDSPVKSELQCGELAVSRLLSGDRGHYGPFEHPQIILNVGGFPHSVMVQLRTHRSGISFDVQSGRYTGARYVTAYQKLEGLGYDFNYIPGVWRGGAAHQAIIEDVIYLRPEGGYRDRQGHDYHYTEQDRKNDLALAAHLLHHYTRKVHKGHAEEHARGMFAYEFRQDFVVSMNLRTLMHLLDLRAKKDAQIECQAFCDLLLPIFRDWTPQIYDWYVHKRLGKARLAP